MENSTMLGFIGGTLNPDPETVENHTRQIESLKKEMEERDKLYKIIFPNSFQSNRNYKMKNIWRDLDRLPQLEEEKQRSRKKWDEVKQKLKWDECYEDAMKALQESRNVDAHPTPLTEEGLVRAAEVMESKGNLKGWLSLKRVNELITMWKNVQTME